MILDASSYKGVQGYSHRSGEIFLDGTTGRVGGRTAGDCAAFVMSRWTRLLSRFESPPRREGTATAARLRRERGDVPIHAPARGRKRPRSNANRNRFGFFIWELWDNMGDLRGCEYGSLSCPLRRGWRSCGAGCPRLLAARGQPKCRPCHRDLKMTNT